MTRCARDTRDAELAESFVELKDRHLAEAIKDWIISLMTRVWSEIRKEDIDIICSSDSKLHFKSKYSIGTRARTGDIGQKWSEIKDPIGLLKCDISIKTSVPEFTDEHRDFIDKMVSSKIIDQFLKMSKLQQTLPPNAVVAEVDRNQCTMADLRTLNGLNWLNDEVNP